MAAVQALRVLDVVTYDTTKLADRQAIVSSVLGTMGTEGELPSDQTQVFMNSFVAGEMTLNETSDAIFAHARRMVDEANDHRLAVR